MTKRNLKKQYKKLVIHYIAKLQICPEHRATLFLDFNENSEVYYDDLCDTLYSISTGELSVPLWLSPNGKVYASPQRTASHHQFLLDCHELPPFNGDLLEGLDCVFTRIYLLSNRRQPLHLCAFS